ncbi:hypothetical protein ACMFMG_011359 [Clarireedia jacksonii]
MIVDAIDECQDREAVLHLLRNVSTQAPEQVYILATSHQLAVIVFEIQNWVGKGCFISFGTEAADRGIENFVGASLKRLHEKGSLSYSVSIDIASELISKAAGMFTWVACQVNALDQRKIIWEIRERWETRETREIREIREIREMLERLPGTLCETYTRILKDMPEAEKPYAIRILQFLAYSDKRLTLEEAIDVMCVSPGADPAFDPDLRMRNKKALATYLSGLVSTSERYPRGIGLCSELQLAHFSVRQYLLSDLVESSFQQSMLEVNASKSIFQVCIAYIGYARKITKENLEKGVSAAKADPHHDAFDLSINMMVLTDVENNFPLINYATSSWIHHANIVLSMQYYLDGLYDFCFQKIEDFHFSRAVQFQAKNSDRSPDTPLCYATSNGCDHVVKFLLEHDVNLRGRDYRDALYTASQKGYSVIVKLLLDHGAEVNREGGFYGNALYAASNYGHSAIVQLLLDRGAEVNRGGIYGNALYAASGGGHSAIVQLLLDHGADPNMRGHHGTALEIASWAGYKDILQILFDAGAVEAQVETGVITTQLNGKQAGQHYFEGKTEQQDQFIAISLNTKPTI